MQDIEAHLFDGIPNADIEDLNKYWDVYPTLKSTLFKPFIKQSRNTGQRANYSELCIDKEQIKNTIFQHPEFVAFSKQMDSVFDKWKNETAAYLKTLDKGLHPKQEVAKISNRLLKVYQDKNLIDRYDVYQHLMDYWLETMQYDMYELAADGWQAGNEVTRMEKNVKKGGKDMVRQVAGIEGLAGRLIPPDLIIQEYFADLQKAIENL